MNGHFSFIAGFFLKICCLIHWGFFSLYAHAYKKEAFPSEQLEQASRAVWQLWAINVFAPSLSDKPKNESKIFRERTQLKRWSVFLGNGFFIAPEDLEQKYSDLLLTKCHFIRKLFDNGKGLEDIQIYNHFHLNPEEIKDPLAIESLVALDCVSNLALLKTKSKVPSYLTIDKPPLTDEGKGLFVLDSIEDSAHLIRQTGQVHQILNHLYFPANYSYLKNSIGSPVTDIYGQMTGMVSDTTANIIFLLETDQLKRFIKGDTGIQCDTKEPQDCLNEAVGLLYKHKEPTHLADSDSPLQMYLQNKQTVDLTKLLAKQGYTPAQHDLAVMCYNGEGMEQSLSCALNWALQAKAQGYFPAEIFLSHLNQMEEEITGTTNIDDTNIHKVSR